MRRLWFLALLATAMLAGGSAAAASSISVSCQPETATSVVLGGVAVPTKVHLVVCGTTVYASVYDVGGKWDAQTGTLTIGGTPGRASGSPSAAVHISKVAYPWRITILHVTTKPVGNSLHVIMATAVSNVGSAGYQMPFADQFSLIYSGVNHSAGLMLSDEANVDNSAFFDTVVIQRGQIVEGNVVFLLPLYAKVQDATFMFIPKDFSSSPTRILLPLNRLAASAFSAA